MRSINRRSFLILAPAVAVAGVSLLPLPSYLSKIFASDEAESAGGELAEVVDEYLKNFPQERDVHFLSEHLALKLENTTAKFYLSEPTIILRIQQDFEEGRVVSLAGWILSKTEARVLVLVSLLGQVK